MNYNYNILDKLNNIGNDLTEKIEKHTTLNQKLFNEDKLRDDVKKAIIKIADTFISELSEEGISFKLKDILLIGSNVSYNYTEDSDLDIHLIADSSSLDCDPEIYTLLYSAYRSMFNTNYDIKIKGIPVEIYVELDETKSNSNGVYSINNGWIKVPEQKEIPDINMEEFEKQFKVWEDKYFELLHEVSNYKSLVENKLSAKEQLLDLVDLLMQNHPYLSSEDIRTKSGDNSSDRHKDINLELSNKDMYDELKLHGYNVKWKKDSKFIIYRKGK